MSDSEFSAAAGFSSGLIPKIDYFVVGTAEQVQSSVRDNLWYLRTDKVGCISRGVSIFVLGPTARKKSKWRQFRYLFHRRYLLHFQK